VALITAFGNIPINNQIVTWNISSPPPNWMDLAQKWWWLQTVRTILAIGGLVFLILTALVRREVTKWEALASFRAPDNSLDRSGERVSQLD